MELVLIDKVDACDWDAFVAASPQGNIFSHSRYLKSLGVQYTCHFVKKSTNGEALAGVAVIENGNAMNAAPFTFTPYLGILFGQATGQPNYKRVTNEFVLTEFLIQRLIARYGNFNMALSHTFADLRPFLWHNYHEVDAPHFVVRNRYTAILDLHYFQIDEYLKTIRAVRRQEFKKTTTTISETTDVPLFLELYQKTFKRQGIDVNKQQIELVKNIVSASLENRYGRLSMAATSEGIASMSLFIYDSCSAYYLFGANDPDLRNSGASTALMVDNIRAMAELGLSQLDFVGVNSPNRGDFKLSFNPRLTAYNEVELVNYNSQ